MLAWEAALLVLSAAALPFTLLAASYLADCGYMLSKAVGLPLVSWSAWQAASILMLSFYLAADHGSS